MQHCVQHQAAFQEQCWWRNTGEWSEVREPAPPADEARKAIGSELLQDWTREPTSPADEARKATGSELLQDWMRGSDLLQD